MELETQQQRLAAYLEHAREHYADETIRALETTAAVVDARVAALGVEERSSYQDTFDLLSTALAEKFPAPTDSDGYSYWGYLVDFGDDWAVFSQKGVKCQVPYSLDGASVTLGEKTPVREVTTYVPVQSNSASIPPATAAVPLSNFATAKRTFSSLVEQPPPLAGEFQVRMDTGTDDDSIAHFVGYASTTGVAYEVRDWLGEYRETMLPGAFAKTLREQSNVPLLFNHDGVPLASTGSGTSRLSEDKVGLRNEADLDRRDALTNSICVQMERGVLSRMSFSFRGVKDSWNDTYDERGVAEAALYDSSVVTYPANPATSAELVESFRSALGREGRSLWLADSELSVRSALPVIAEGLELDGDTGDLLERALRALAHADEIMCRQQGPHGRARTFHVASTIVDLRAGKKLSAKNEGLLKTAMDALSAADKQHADAAKNHAAASEALNSVLGGGQDGTGNGTPPGNGNPIAPQDGAGPRSASLTLKRQREAELRALRRP